jgi:hypothetical protein
MPGCLSRMAQPWDGAWPVEKRRRDRSTSPSSLMVFLRFRTLRPWCAKRMPPSTHWGQRPCSHSQEPLLVNAGQRHPAFRENLANRHITSALGVDADGLIWAISADPVNCHEGAPLFRDELGCPDALFLEGVISQFHAPGLGYKGSAATLGPMRPATEEVTGSAAPEVQAHNEKSHQRLAGGSLKGNRAVRPNRRPIFRRSPRRPSGGR